MKKFLLILFLISGALFSFNYLKAQCDLSSPSLTRAFSTNVTSLGPNKCQYTIDVSFNIVTNSGFKYLFFHSWLAQDYPNPSIFDCGGNTPAADPGTSAQLGTVIDEPGKSFSDIGFINLNELTFTANTPVDVTANLATTYPHDPSVVLNSTVSPGITATVTRLNNSDTLHFDIHNLQIILNTPCGTPVLVMTDIWGSNSNAPDPKAQCYICGFTTSSEPHIALQKLCTSVPFQYRLALTAQSTTGYHVVYRLYADDLDGVIEPTGDDSLLFVSDTIFVSASSPYTSGLVTLPDNFCCVDPWAQWGIYAQVTAREFDNTLSTPVIEEACASAGTLPITLRSFTASRTNSNVLLKWETVTEENNRGFYIERNGAGGWQTLGFVRTNAVNGNSNSALAYTYTDINDSKGITQYRLRQIDIDGKYAYSPIRAVRATGQQSKTIIYPNPSNDGRVNVVFADVENTRDVFLSDVNGRTLKQWKGVKNNTIQIDNLVAGFYTIRIIDTETGEQTVEKIVVKKR